MTSESLARSYLVKAQKRLKALAVLRDEDAHSDVVREAQELVELALKGVLRAIGVEPPKFHDVGGLLIEHRDKLASEARADVPPRPRSRSGCVVSGSSAADAQRAYAEAAWVLDLAARVIGSLSGSSTP